MKDLASQALLAGLMACLAQYAQAGVNLVVNGGFESGDLSGWTLSGATANTLVLAIDEGIPSNSGNYRAQLGNSIAGAMEQVIATTPGANYTVDLYVARAGQLAGGSNFSFDGSFGGTPFLILSTAEFPVNSPWTQFTATVVATGPSTVLRFDHFDAPSWTMVDDISVTAVPESAQWLLMLAGLGAVGAISHRRQQPAD